MLQTADYCVGIHAFSQGVWYFPTFSDSCRWNTEIFFFSNQRLFQFTIWVILHVSLFWLPSFSFVVHFLFYFEGPWPQTLFLPLVLIEVTEMYPCSHAGVGLRWTTARPAFDLCSTPAAHVGEKVYLTVKAPWRQAFLLNATYLQTHFLSVSATSSTGWAPPFNETRHTPPCFPAFLFSLFPFGY